MTKPKPLKPPPSIIAAAHPALTNWGECERTIEKNGKELTCVYRFKGVAPSARAAIWKQSTVAALKLSLGKHVVEVIETHFEDLDGPTIRMQHDPAGVSLHQLLESHEAVPDIAMRWRILESFFTAVAELHGAGFVHRELDLKAVRVFLDGPVHAKLTNFMSIAKLADPAAISDAPALLPYTESADPLDQRSDVIAMGLISSQVLSWTFISFTGASFDEAIRLATRQAEGSVDGKKAQKELAGLVTRLLGGTGSITRAKDALDQLRKIAVPSVSARRPRTPTFRALLGASAAATIAAGVGSYTIGPVKTPITPVTLDGTKWNSHNEWIGWVTGLCSAKVAPPKPAPDCGCSVDPSDFVWQNREDLACLQAKIMEENCKALKDTKNPKLVVPFMGIFTNLPPNSYHSLFGQLHGLYAVQKSANEATHSDAVKIIIPIGNGGMQQAKADEVVKVMLHENVHVSAFMGFADSRGGSARAIAAACNEGVLVTTPTLSATDLSAYDCLVSMVPSNQTEAELFLTYAKKRGFDTVTLVKSYGPGVLPSDDDLYIDSLKRDAVSAFEASGLKIIPQELSDGFTDADCPVGKHMVLSDGRYTDYVFFLDELVTSCDGKFDPNNVVANDSASRIPIGPRDEALKRMPMPELQARLLAAHAERAKLDPEERAARLHTDPLIHELARRIPVAVKSFELKGNANTGQRAADGCQAPLTAKVCTYLGDGGAIIPRDALLSATALELLRESAERLYQKSKDRSLTWIPAAELRKQFVEDLANHPPVHGEPTDSDPFDAKTWRLMPTEHPRKFVQQGDGHFTPLYAPITLVLRSEAAGDELLCGCAHLDSEKSDAYCTCFE